MARRARQADEVSASSFARRSAGLSRNHRAGDLGDRQRRVVDHAHHLPARARLAGRRRKPVARLEQQAVQAEHEQHEAGEGRLGRGGLVFAAVSHDDRGLSICYFEAPGGFTVEVLC
jgi:Rad3-related DNA helicase